MKILIDLTDLDDHITGIERYAMELTKELVSSDAEFILLFKNQIHPAFKHMTFKWNVKCRVVEGGSKFWFRQFVLPGKLRKFKADKYVFLAFPEPLLFFNKNIYTAVHDMSAWDCGQYMKFLSKWFFRISNIHTFLFAKKIITISKFSASRICHYAKTVSDNTYTSVRERLVLIRCGVNYTKPEISQKEMVKEAIHEAADNISTAGKNVFNAVVQNVKAAKESETVKKANEFVKDKALLIKDKVKENSTAVSILGKLEKLKETGKYIVVDAMSAMDLGNDKNTDVIDVDASPREVSETDTESTDEEIKINESVREDAPEDSENPCTEISNNTSVAEVTEDSNNDNSDNTKRDKSVQEIYGIEGKYILSLSTIEARKNLKVLIKAYRQLFKTRKDVPKLVLAGRKGWKTDNLLKGYSSKFKEHIIFTGFVEEEHLDEIYAGAECFVFPSLYEGFGMTPVEAMIRETPVISSDAASMPEVLGDAVIYFKSDDSDDLAEKISYMLDLSPSDRAILTIKGKAQAEKYSWKKEADKLGRVLGIPSKNKKN